VLRGKLRKDMSNGEYRLEALRFLLMSTFIVLGIFTAAEGVQRLMIP
jgi:hypothetical protein